MKQVRFLPRKLGWSGERGGREEKWKGADDHSVKKEEIEWGGIFYLRKT